MRCRSHTPLLITLLSGSLALAGCSSSDDDAGSSAAIDASDRPNTTQTADQLTAGDGAATDSEAIAAGDATVAAGVPAGPADDAPAADVATDPTGSAESSDPTAINSGITAGPGAEGQTAADDYSPTATESASLAGPSRVDTAMGAGPPTAPGGLVALMTSSNWVEFSWTPSADDQAVVAYEIYRNSELIHTVTGDNEAETTQWLTTSYMDCNYTKNAECVTTQPASGSENSYSVVAVDNEGLRSQPSEAVTLGLLGETTSTVNLAEYEPVFEEEFEGQSLDRSKWKTSLAWGADTIINGETQYFVDTFGAGGAEFGYDPFVFNGETMSIEGIPTPPELAEKANGQPYLSGVISTLNYFNMTYGYVEMSAQLAGGAGLLSTFYLFNDDYERNKPEIDIVEYIGADASTPYQTYHYYDSNKSRAVIGEKHSSPTMVYDGGVDYSAGFHTYAVSWEPELMIWYVDGIEVQRIAGPRVSDEKMHIVAQMVIGSNWIGEPAAGTQFPVKVEIDYIRAYQRTGAVEAGATTEAVGDTTQ